MTGERLAQLMTDPTMRRAVAKAARRMTKCVEDQEEYIQDAWVRISGCQDDSSVDHLGKQARNAVYASCMRKRYALGVKKKTGQNLNGISRDLLSNYKRSDLQPLGRGRYLVLTPEKLDSWYYHKEREEYGLTESGVQVRSYYKIVVS